MRLGVFDESWSTCKETSRKGFTTWSDLRRPKVLGTWDLDSEKQAFPGKAEKPGFLLPAVGSCAQNYSVDILN